jgi:uncharacterized damage-inducible protein DinB
MRSSSRRLQTGDMLQSDMTLMFDHLYWMRDRILDAAEDEGVPFTQDHPATLRDLRATLVHELDVEWSWRERLRSDDPTTFGPETDLVPDDYGSAAAVRAHWARDEIEMRTWIATLTDEQLAGPCRAEPTTSHPLWFHLQHLYTHAIQQLSDAAVLLTAAGRSPGELDFGEFVAHLRPAPA